MTRTWVDDTLASSSGHEGSGAAACVTSQTASSCRPRASFPTAASREPSDERERVCRSAACCCSIASGVHVLLSHSRMIGKAPTCGEVEEASW